MDRKLRRQVVKRANSRCEYCQMPQEYAEPIHEIDHVVAQKHGGVTVLENLALACFHCNNHKGPNIAGLDPETGEVTRLFDPRQDVWRDHFVWQGALLVGTTKVGRTTTLVLKINSRHRVAHRAALIDEGVFPPSDNVETV